MLVVVCLVQACTSGASYVKQGEALEAEGRYQEAISLYQSVIASGEVAPEKVLPRLDAARGALGAQRAERALAALEAGRVEEAVVLLKEAIAIAPSHPTVERGVKALVGTQMARASDLQAQGDVAGAVALLDMLLGVVPDDPSVREVRDALADAYSERLEAEIRDFDRRDLSGNAFVGALVLASLNPDRPELARMVDVRRKNLLRRYQVPVYWTVSSRGGPVSDLVAALNRVAFHQPLLVRAEGESGADGLRVSLSDVEESVTEAVENGTAVKSVPVGKRLIPNPRVQALRAEQDELTRTIERVGEQIDTLTAQLSSTKDLGARSRIQTKLEALSREYNELGTRHVGLTEQIEALPQQIEAVAYQDVTIPVRVHRRLLRLSATYRGVGERSDLPVNVRFALWGEASTEGESHDAFPEYRLPAESVVFALSDDVLRRQAARALAQKVAATTDTVVNDLLVLELQKGRRSVERGETEAAVESFVKVVLGTTLPIPEDVQAFLRNRGLVDPARIRGAPVTHEAAQ